jgi:zinc protease
VEAQYKLIDKFSPPEGVNNPLDIPYVKYQLDNGLTVIIHEDKSDPVVHVDVTYHVGSAREEIGISGFAHFFEHMMFQGSKNVGDEQHFKIIQNAGGTLNGTTNRDRTNYFETMPSNYLETALWLEADRMGFLLEAVNQEKFEIQRATVKNEKAQRYNNVPYGLVGENVSKNLYPYAHPYSWPTIGYVEDLDRVTVEDLKRFFLRWYGPNNAVLTIGGNIDGFEAIELANKYFGAIPRGPEVEVMKPTTFRLEKPRYVSMEDNVRFPMLRVVFPAVHNGHEDEAPLDILCEILGGGKESIMYNKYVATQKLLSASAYNPSFELSGELTFNLMGYPTTSLKDAEQMLRDAWKEFEIRGVKQEDIDKYYKQRYTDAINSLETVSSKVSQLAANQTFRNSPNALTYLTDRYKNVKPEDVIRVYNKYIKAQPALFFSVYPKGKKELKANIDTYTAGKADTIVSISDEYKNLSPRFVKKDNINRKKQPKAGKTPVVSFPTPKVFNMPFGGTITYIENKELPIVNFTLYMPAGSVYQPTDKSGMIYLLTSMLQEGTPNMSAAEVEKKLALLGSSVSFGATSEYLTMSVQCLKENLMETISIGTEMLVNPRFDEQDFDRIKKRTLENLANLKNQPTSLANIGFNELMWGKDHIFGINGGGTETTIKNISLNDLKEFHQNNLTGLNSKILLVGDISEEDIMGPFMALGALQPLENAKPNVPEPKARQKTTIYLIDKPGAAQSEIRVGYMSIPADLVGDYYTATVMNYPLGGSFNSRININLREKKGYTYGARSYLTGSKFPGAWMVSTGVKADKTDSALSEIIKEIDNFYEKGITKEELAYTKKALLEGEALRYESNGKKISYLYNVAMYDFPEDYMGQRANYLKKLNRKTINKLAKKMLNSKEMTIVIAGDVQNIKAGIEKLNLGEIKNLELKLVEE